ncbi:MAG: GtrA family protein [Saprospiraceae bacterium]|nr:GtrA family protein [Saprospiraceae bacterium]
MASIYQKLQELFKLKLRFAMTSAVATAVDYGLFMLLVDRFFQPAIANVISFSSAVLLNFYLQKRFVFVLRRESRAAFWLAILVSLGGLLLSTGIITGLNTGTFFRERQYLTKFVATGIVFFYNFYLKRFAFEKRFLSND